MVSHLRMAIKTEEKPELDAITAGSLDLWKVTNLIQHTDNDEFIYL
jgi:hypothetical protein